MTADFQVRDDANVSRPGKIIARFLLKRDAKAHADRLNADDPRRLDGLPPRYRVTAD